MRTRKRFQPADLHPLEDRKLLSSNSSFFNPLGAVSAFKNLFHLNKKQAGNTVLVGTLGDSYTDEYRFYPPFQSHARNWVEILANTRGVSFGQFSTKSRGEPRNQGFALDWARWGSTSSDMVRTQLPGLAAQVGTGRVRYAWIFTGGNDFLYFLQGVQQGTIPASEATADLAQLEQTAASNVNTAISTLLAANANIKLVVVTVPDVSLLPAVQSQATTPALQAVVAATDQAIHTLNASIAAAASANPCVALYDLAGQSAILASTASNASVPFGGTTINFATPGQDYHDFFVGDGIHPGTVGQGLIAEGFIQTIDTKFGAHIADLSPNQIVAYARTVQNATRRGAGPP
jgi:hypothetical protein